MHVTVKQLRLLISEKIRSNQEQKFNIKEFESLSDPQSRQEYCDDRLQVMGEGSTRKVYVLTSKTALKLALNRRGEGQNSAETKMSQDPEVASIIAKVLRSAPDDSWIVSELVKPVGDVTLMFNKKFNAEFGAPADANDALLKQMLLSDESDLEKYFFRGPIPEKTIQFMRAFQGIVNKYDVEFSDATKASSWGRAPDGRLVLLDYGFNGEVVKNYYK